MNKRDKNRLRTRVRDALHASGQVEAARAAWQSAWQSRRAGILKRDVDRARLAMLQALDRGASIAEAEQTARDELALEPLL